MAKNKRSSAKAVQARKGEEIKKVSKARESQSAKRASHAETVEAAIRECGFSDETMSKILTMIGTGGFCKSPPPSDLVVRNFLALHLNAELPRATLSTNTNRRRVKIEVFDDCCVSQVTAPKLHIKALRSRMKALATQCGAETICSVRPFMVADASSEVNQCGYGVRAIGYVGTDFDPEAALAKLRVGKIFATSNVPEPTIRFVDSEDSLPKLIAWLISLPTRPFELGVDENAARRWKAHESVLSAQYAVRQLESLTAIPFADAIFAIGSHALPILTNVIRAVSSAHAGRVKEGLVNEKLYETWIAWGEGWPEVAGPTFLPFRTDVPLKAPRAPKPARTLASMHKERRSGKGAKSTVKRGRGPKTGMPGSHDTRH